jgi:hypothetical protein
MYEDRLPLPDKHQVRLSWQIAKTTPIFNSHLSNHTAHNHLGPSALGTDPAHYLAALGPGKCIHFLQPNLGQTFSHWCHFGNTSRQVFGLNKAMKNKIKAIPVLDQVGGGLPAQMESSHLWMSR